jgi:hypothetical protein
VQLQTLELGLRAVRGLQLPGHVDHLERRPEDGDVAGLDAV